MSVERFWISLILQNPQRIVPSSTYYAACIGASCGKLHNPQRIVPLYNQTALRECMLKKELAESSADRSSLQLLIHIFALNPKTLQNPQRIAPLFNKSSLKHPASYRPSLQPCLTGRNSTERYDLQNPQRIVLLFNLDCAKSAACSFGLAESSSDRSPLQHVPCAQKSLELDLLQNPHRIVPLFNHS